MAQLHFICSPFTFFYMYHGSEPTCFQIHPFEPLTNASICATILSFQSNNSSVHRGLMGSHLSYSTENNECVILVFQANPRMICLKRYHCLISIIHFLFTKHNSFLTQYQQITEELKLLCGRGVQTFVNII